MLRRLRLGDDSGLSLVEAVVSLLIASLVLTALAYAAIGAVRASLISRQKQQAVDLATQRIEQVRALDYSAIALRPSDLSSDPRITACNGSPCISVGEGQREVIVTSPTGLAPHITTVQGQSVNNTVFSMGTYVTRPADSQGADYRRVTVTVEWTTGSTTNSETMSTFITYQQRGLPLPRFKLIARGPTAVTVNPGVEVAFGFTLTNQGAPDRWNLSSSGSAAWTYVRDNGDGFFDEDTDVTPLTDTNGDGNLDTGFLAPTASITYWAYRVVTETSGTITTSFTATSSLQPLVASGKRSVIDRVTVVSGVITPSPTPSSTPSTTSTPTSTPTPTSTSTEGPPVTCTSAAPVPAVVPVTGYSTVSYTLHNTSAAVSWPTLPLPASGPVPGSTALAPPMYMDRRAVAIPAGRPMPVYSSDLPPADTGGRIVNIGGSLTSPEGDKAADWTTQSRVKSYSGTAVLSLWVAAVPGVPAAPVALKAQVYTRSSTISGVAAPVSLSVSPFTCAGFQLVWAQLPLGTFKVTGQSVLGVKVWNDGSTAVRLGYDTAEMPASLVVNEK